MKFDKYLKLIAPIAAILSLASAGLILYFINKYGVNVPYNDQWEYVGFFDHLSQGMLTIEELFRQHNEYRQFFPNVIYVALGSFTHWNVRYEMLVIFLLACLVAFNIYRLAGYTQVGKPWQKWLMFFLANLFIFSPMQWENWLFGVQIEYFLPIACVSTGLVLAFTRMPGLLKMILCMALALISTFSSINGFIIWILLFPVLAFSGTKNEYFKKGTIIAIWIAATLEALAIYFSGYQKPGAHPSLSIVLHHPLDALFYFFGTLGNTLRVIHYLWAILVVGGMLFFVFLAQILYVVWHIKDKLLLRNALPWVMLGWYAMGTAAMLTVGRLGFGTYQSLASRYTSFTLYGAVAVIFLAGLILQHYFRVRGISVKQKIVIAALVVLLVGAKVNNYQVGVNELKSFHAAIIHAKAGLLCINYVPHEECANKVYPANFAEIHRTANILNRLGYLNPPLIRSDVMQDLEDMQQSATSYGSLDTVFYLHDNVYKAWGTAMMPNTKGAADAVLLSYETPDGKSKLFTLQNTDSIRWTKTFTLDRVPQNPMVIRAWAFDANSAKAYKLKGMQRVVLP